LATLLKMNSEIDKTSIAYLSNFDISKFKRCQGNLTPECLGTSYKENYKGLYCNSCYKAKQSTYEREKRKKLNEEKMNLTDEKIFLIKLNELISKLYNEKSQFITSTQLEQISKILNPTQTEFIITVFNVSDQNPDVVKKPELKITSIKS